MITSKNYETSEKSNKFMKSVMNFSTHLNDIMNELISDFNYNFIFYIECDNFQRFFYMMFMKTVVLKIIILIVFCWLQKNVLS